MAVYLINTCAKTAQDVQAHLNDIDVIKSLRLKPLPLRLFVVQDNNKENIKDTQHPIRNFFYFYFTLLVYSHI